MPGRFPYKILAKYPHMMPQDVDVWEAYIHKNPNAFGTVEYDLKVGKGAEVDTNAPENMQRDHTILTQKKIDAVGYNTGEVWIIEVKPIANARALGQILTYIKLYKDEHGERDKIEGMIVCYEVEREMDALFKEHGILIGIA
jgi:hypothetical protein